MHRTKKLLITATVAALLSASGMSSALANRGNDNDNDNDKVTICHATGSETNPYVLITVDESAVDGEGENDHSHHEDDIIPAPVDEDGDPFCPGGTTPPPGGEDPDDDDDAECIASSDSEQEQKGLINVGINVGNNLLGNALCQVDVLNGLGIAVIGDALGGDLDDDDSDDGDCIASSDSEQEQEGAINVGINVGNNLLGNALCQVDVLNGLAVSVIGTAVGGPSSGGGLLGGGLLTGLLSADASLLASVLVLL